MAEKQDSHITGNHERKPALEQELPGPVRLHNRTARGLPVLDNPNGVGKPSTVSTIANGGKKGW
jgi:hypothetical protein